MVSGHGQCLTRSWPVLTYQVSSYMTITRATDTGSLLLLTSWHTVPGPSVSDAVFEAGVIIVLTAWGSVRVGHYWVVHGVGPCQRLEHHIIWTSAVLMSGSLKEK